LFVLVGRGRLTEWEICAQTPELIKLPTAHSHVSGIPETVIGIDRKKEDPARQRSTRQTFVRRRGASGYAGEY
jgi:hypothetical protein